jgi:hypothetical protein
MSGKSKHAERLAKHLNEPVDAACAVSRPGSAAGQVAGGVGGLAGVAASGGLRVKGKAVGNDINVGTISWLGLGPTGFTLTKGDNVFGKPKGEPFERLAYSEVASVTLTAGKITIRADVVLGDGRTFALETKNRGPVNKPNVEVLELFRDRANP